METVSSNQSNISNTTSRIFSRLSNLRGINCFALRENDDLWMMQSVFCDLLSGFLLFAFLYRFYRGINLTHPIYAVLFSNVVSSMILCFLSFFHTVLMFFKTGPDIFICNFVHFQHRFSLYLHDITWLTICGIKYYYLSKTEEERSDVTKLRDLALLWKWLIIIVLIIVQIFMYVLDYLEILPHIIQVCFTIAVLLALNVSFFSINFGITKTLKHRMEKEENNRKEDQQQKEVSSENNSSQWETQNRQKVRKLSNLVISNSEDKTICTNKDGVLNSQERNPDTLERSHIQRNSNNTINKIEVQIHLPNQVIDEDCKTFQSPIIRPQESRIERNQHLSNNEENVDHIDRISNSSSIESIKSIDSAYASSNGTAGSKMKSDLSRREDVYKEQREHISIIRTMMANAVLILLMLLMTIVFRRTPNHIKIFARFLISSLMKLYRNFSTLLASMYCFEEISYLFGCTRKN